MSGYYCTTTKALGKLCCYNVRNNALTSTQSEITTETKSETTTQAKDENLLILMFLFTSKT